MSTTPPATSPQATAPPVAANACTPAPKPKPTYWAMGTGHTGYQSRPSTTPVPSVSGAGPSSGQYWAMGLGASTAGMAPPADMGGHQWTWQWPGRGPGLVVSGGSTAVNTDDLRQLANALTNASMRLNIAMMHAGRALHQVQNTTIPHPPPQPTNAKAAYPASQQTPASTPVYTGPDPDEVRRLRDAAEEDLKLARDGTPHTACISSVADYLHGLASDVLVCASMYDAANCKATPNPRSRPVGPATPLGSPPLSMRGLKYGVLAGPVVAVGSMPNGTTVLQAVAPVAGEKTELALDAIQGLDTLLADDGTEAWVKTDLLRLVLLADFASQAKTGRESATVQAEMQHAAERLDPWVKERLPNKVQVGSQWVDPATLTPVQRCTLYLALLSAESGEKRYGPNQGVDVSQRASGPSSKAKSHDRTVHVPKSTDDPFGLGTQINADQHSAGDGYQPPKEAPTGTISDTITRSNTLQNKERIDAETAAVSITRIEHLDGTRSYRVIIPGTVDWGSGSPAAQDLLTNLQGAAGMPTDMESGVVTAMRMAGIRPEDEVMLYGHSQGGITAVNIAADPEVAKDFTITEVLTAGSPTAHAKLPESVHALHLENGGDAVPALDGAPTLPGPNRTIVQLDTHEQETEYPHQALVYAKVAENLEQAGEPAVDEWSKHHKRLMGVGEQVTLPGGAVVTATTTEVIYDVRRTVGQNPPPSPSPQLSPSPQSGKGSGQASGQSSGTG